MDVFAERWAELKKLLEEGLALEGEDRAAFIACVRQKDPVLCDELERMLEIDGQADPVVDKQLQVAARGDAEPPLPASIGPFRVIRRLGSGGMGTVYLARRADDQMGTEVAVKVLNSGAASAQSIRRFHLERQILSELTHPNIARLQEGGSVDGLPFFAMEYVREGLPITTWCRRRKLDLEARLRLFEKVSRAVHFAHRNQVIHRDLKPGNILVGENGIPKLLDFGIARLERPEEEGETRTLTSLQALTPEYASPEQLAGLTVTTSSDIYALGLLLFELLTGSRPFSHSTGRLDLLEAMKTTLPKPSMRVAELITGNLKGGSTLPEGWDAARLRRRLKGDLDNIVLMALRREPERRYDSAMELAQDVARHLNGFPVHARSESLGYMALRFLGRHKAASLTATALLVGLAAVTGFGLQRQETARAARNAAALSAYTTGLMHIFDPYDPQTSTRDPKTMLLNLRQKLNTFDGDPQTHAALLHATGKALLGQGLLNESEAVLSRALSMREHFQGESSLVVADTLEQLGDVHFFRGGFAAAERHYLQAMALRENIQPVDHPDIGVGYMLLGRLYVSNYERTRPVAFLEKAREILRPHAVYQSAYLEATRYLGILYFFDDAPACEPYLEESKAISETYGNHPLHAESLLYLGRYHFFYKDREKGRAYIDQALAITDEVLVGDHYAYVTLLTLMAEIQRFIDHPNSLETFKAARCMSERQGLLETPDKLFMLSCLFQEQMRALDFEGAMEVNHLSQRIMARCRTRPDLYSSNQLNYGTFLVTQNAADLAGVRGDQDRMLAMHRESWQAYEQLEIYHPSYLIPQLAMLAPLEASRGDRPLAFRYLEKIEREMSTILIADPQVPPLMHFRISGLRALAAFERGEVGEAECRLREDLDWVGRVFAPRAQYGTAKAACRLAGLLQQLGSLEEARGLLVLAEDQLWTAHTPFHPVEVEVLNQVEAYLAAGPREIWPMVF